MDDADFADRYTLKLNFLSSINPECPGASSTTEMKQRIKALVTNIRPSEPLTEEKIQFIATRLPALSRMLSDTHFYDSSYTPLDNRSTLKVLWTPYRPSPSDAGHLAWKVFTGSKCRVYRPPRQATAYGQTRPAQPLRPQPIPSIPLEMPWHPDGPEDANEDMDLITEYSHQYLDDGQSIEEILSPVKNAGGEEIPGLWRFSGYNSDGTIYLSVIINIKEKKQKVEKPALSLLSPTANKRKADDSNSHDNEPPFKKRQIYI